MFLEMARALAIDVAVQTPDTETDSAAVATNIFRRLLTRPPTDAELAAIVDYQKTQLERLSSGDLKASEILTGKTAKGLTPEQQATQASWAMVARALMNLDETITHP